jgi:hypothetical protein
MTQKPMLRAEVGMRVRCANSQKLQNCKKCEAFVGSAHSAETIKRKPKFGHLGAKHRFRDSFRGPPHPKGEKKKNVIEGDAVDRAAQRMLLTMPAT